MTQNEAKRKIQELVAKYEIVKSSGKINSYSEQDTKDSFIRPMFEALGWDFDNRDEVTKEEDISGDRVDYGIYLNGQPKLFIEAKKLRANLNDPKHADQAIKYCFNRVVTWAVLTDFESLKVFNAQNVSENLTNKLYFEIPCSDYIERFDQLWQLSKESFETGLIEKEAMKWGKLTQKVTVTEQLAKDLNEIRDMLTRSLHQWNNQVSASDLDEGVQKLLDRLIFLRVAEDRKIEEPILKQLIRDYHARKNAGEKIELYESMIAKFRELDDVYNSGLFSPHPFEKWEEYGQTERAIDILYGKSGYYEYDFKFIPSDVLGQVYENYLGHLLNKSRKGLTLDVSAKKRKEQGIYYTPSYIEEYIVKQALKPVLDKCNSIAELKGIKILDPACGSGSFLIKAMEMLAEKYVQLGGRTLDKSMLKLNILLENIYGVDLDEKAVEIARLNLLINSLDTRMKLPKIEHIKNGNSLIAGTDEELEEKFGKNYHDVKAFNWEIEFPEVFNRSNPGFDVIIGNPPYIKEFVNKSAFDGLRDSPYYQGKMDLWTLFACKDIDLLRNGGVLSFIAPNNWVTNAGASVVREKVLKETQILEYIDFGGYQVFENAGIQTMIFSIQKKEPDIKYKLKYLLFSQDKHIENEIIARLANSLQVMEFKPEDMKQGIEFSSGSNSEVGELLTKIASKRNFELTQDEVAQGIVGAPDECFLVDSTDNFSDNEREYLKRYYTSVKKYVPGKSKYTLIYLSAKNFSNHSLSDYPNLLNHFAKYEKVLKEAKTKYKTPDKPYYYLHRERDEKFFRKGEKIIASVRTYKPAFYYTKDEYYGSRALNFIQSERIELPYLTGILNSKLVAFWLKHKGKKLGNLLQIDKGPLLQIPIHLTNNNTDQKSLIKLVDEITLQGKNLNLTSENSDKWHELNREIEKIDKQIDQFVYKAYNLTLEEISIVEGK